MAQEAKNVSSTSEARNQMFLNSLENASAALGEVFKPALDSVRDAVIPVLNAFADFTKENPTFVAAIVGIAGAFTGVLTILGGVLAVLPILASGWAILTTRRNGCCCTNLGCCRCYRCCRRCRCTIV